MVDSLGGAPLAGGGGEVMTWGGIIAMVLSVGGTTGFFAWCIWRILRAPGETKKMHGVLDTELAIEEEERRRREGRGN